jgi:hypothetical protein
MFVGILLYVLLVMHDPLVLMH